MNTVQHFVGNHAHCYSNKVSKEFRAPLADKHEAQQEFQVSFFEATHKLITKSLSGLNTQLCETFNLVKVRYADKTTSWKISWQARTIFTIMQLNNP
jgi:hypothetical protein